MTSETEKMLINTAKAAAKNAYAPYSGFCVGAALLCEDGAVYAGANVESASYGGCICAERAALAAAISAGERVFEAICISAGDKPTPPCGICRQSLAEFGDMQVIYTDKQGAEVRRRWLSELLPEGFTLSV